MHLASPTTKISCCQFLSAIGLPHCRGPGVWLSFVVLLLPCVCVCCVVSLGHSCFKQDYITNKAQEHFYYRYSNSYFWGNHSFLATKKRSTYGSAYSSSFQIFLWDMSVNISFGSCLVWYDLSLTDRQYLAIIVTLVLAAYSLHCSWLILSYHVVGSLQFC